MGALRVRRPSIGGHLPPSGWAWKRATTLRARPSSWAMLVCFALGRFLMGAPPWAEPSEPPSWVDLEEASLLLGVNATSLGKLPLSWA